MVQAYARLSDSEKAINGFTKVLQKLKNLDFSDQISLLVSIIERYSNFPNTEKIRKELDKVCKSANEFEVPRGDIIRVACIKTIIVMEGNDAIEKGMDFALVKIDSLFPPQQVLVLSSLIDNYRSLTETAEVNRGLLQLRQTVEKTHTSTQVKIFLLLAEAFSKYSSGKEANDCLDKVSQVAETFDLSDKINSLILLTETFIKINNIDRALLTLSQMLELINLAPSDIKLFALVRTVVLLTGNSINGIRPSK